MTRTRHPNALLALLVSHRLGIYVAGVVAIGLPLVLDRGTSATISPPVRTALVVGSLGVMLATYLGERRHDTPTAPATSEHPRYSLQQRITAAGAVLGIALGAYMLSQGELAVGLLFAGGALLFGKLAFDPEGRDD